MNNKNILNSFVCAFLLLGVLSVRADLAFAPTEVTVKGAAATKIAEMMIVGNDDKGTHAQGNAKISCLQKPKEKDFTCVIKKTSSSK